VPSDISLGSYIKNIRTYIIINYFMAALVPLEVASRYFQVHYQIQNYGHADAPKFALYVRLALGFLSLLASLSYQWKKRNAAVALGALLCLGGFYYWGTILYHALTMSARMWFRIMFGVEAFGALLFYSLQLHFVSSYFREIDEDA